MAECVAGFHNVSNVGTITGVGKPITQRSPQRWRLLALKDFTESLASIEIWTWVGERRNHLWVPGLERGQKLFCFVVSQRGCHGIVSEHNR